MNTKQLPHVHIEKELTFPFTCPLCDTVFQEGLKNVCHFVASDMPKDEWAIHVHVVKFFSCVSCGAIYMDKGEECLQSRLMMLMEKAIPMDCECRSYALAGELKVGRN